MKKETVLFTILVIGCLKYVHKNSLFKLQVRDLHEANEKCLFLFISPISEICISFGARGSVVGWGNMLQAEDRGFDSRWGHWIFQLT
jgi:hypothetical protein